MDGEVISMLLGSSGTNVTGNSSYYSVTLPLPIHLNGKFQMALRSLSFPRSAGTFSVLVFCSVLDQSVINNSLQPLLFRTRPIKTTDDNPVYIEETSTLPVWRNIDSRTLQQLDIWLTQSDGTPIPSNGFTIVEVLIRKVAD